MQRKAWCKAIISILQTKAIVFQGIGVKESGFIGDDLIKTIVLEVFIVYVEYPMLFAGINFWWMDFWDEDAFKETLGI